MNFHGERRSAATHAIEPPTVGGGATGPQSDRAEKPRLCYAGHAQMDSRHGLVVNTRLTQASGIAEPTAALAMAAADRRPGSGHVGD